MSAALVVCSFSSFVFGQVRVSSRTVPQVNSAGQTPTSPAERYDLGAAPQSDLGPIDNSQRDAPAPREGLVRVAIHRTLGKAHLKQGTWQKAANGASVWRLDIHSASAAGIRLHFKNFLVSSGQVWVHDTFSPSKQVFGPYTGKGRNGDGDFWTEVLFSDTVEVEYEPGLVNANPGQPPFQIAELSHIWQFGETAAPRQTTSAFKIAGLLGESNAASPFADSATTSRNYSCYLDALCSSEPEELYSGALIGAQSTAILLFTEPTGTYQCSGTMLNAPNAAPLLLTAGHCINTREAARSLVALFRAYNYGCSRPFPAQLTQSDLRSLPQANGLQLVSYANQPFLSERSDSQVHNDLDYALVQLQDFPYYYGLALSGYDATPVLAGQEFISISSPYALYLKSAVGKVLPNLWNSGFDADQSAHGRVGSGSSGSGAFDTSGRLIGVLSTAEVSCSDPQSCPNATSCDVTGAFLARYTSFSAIYPAIRNFLTQPLDSSAGALRSNPNIFSASPITNRNADGKGDATLTMNAPANVSQVEIHVGSPNGPLFYAGSGAGSAIAQGWVSEGLVFYLQDVSNNQPRTAANTIATATAHRSAATFTANPPVILFPDTRGYGSMTLNWTVPGAQFVEVHVGSPTGTLFTYQGGPSGWAYAGDIVGEGTTFYLCDVSNGPCSDQNTVATLTAHVMSDPLDKTGRANSDIVAFPNPAPVLPATAFGQTTLYWRAPGESEVSIHVNSPTGPLLSVGGASGSVTTGNWVTDGMTFYLIGQSGITVRSVSVALAGSGTQ